jgi:enoyl-CoA hydratase
MFILATTLGALGRIHLNRPKAINALTLEMIHDMETAFTRFEDDPAIAAVLVTGEGERGLCAGGDIRALYEHGRDGVGEAFFRAEYRMNAHIAAYKKPYIAFMDGITMGGGVGISAHGSLRIVTQRTRLAMPETGIGFFPDVGATWLLTRQPGELGTYIGLTGEAIGGADAILAGLADYFVPSEELPALAKALADSADPEALVKTVAKPVQAPLSAHRAEIDAAFAHDTVEEIIAALSASGSEFAVNILQTLKRRSPTSLKVTLRLLRAARHKSSLRECLEQEYAAAHAVLASDEFYEGVRAAVIDKDRNPRWSPAAIEAVSAATVEKYFRPATTTLFKLAVFRQIRLRNTIPIWRKYGDNDVF